MKWIRAHKMLSIFIIVLCLGWSRYDGRFTPQRWAETDISHRGKLVGSLLRQYNDLEGMTRTEVEALLGSDTDGMQVRETYRPDGSTERTPMLVYAIGGRPWAVFPEYLYITLENDCVTDTQIVAD